MASLSEFTWVRFYWLTGSMSVVNIRRSGTWHRPGEPYDASKIHDDIKYTEEDDKAIDDWIADHVETTWHSLGLCFYLFQLT